MKGLLVALWCLAVTLGPARLTVAESISSHFETGTEGWLASGDSMWDPIHVGAGGNPGGHIEVTDLVIGDVWYFNAPAKFLGNQSGAYNQTLSFDLWQTGSGSQFTAGDVILNGGNLQLAIDAGPNPLPLESWVSYQVLLNEWAGWRVGDLKGPAATKADLQAVLGFLTALRIRGEFITGPDVGGLDNVVLRVVPEPSTLLLMSIGALAFVTYGCRKQRER